MDRPLCLVEAKLAAPEGHVDERKLSQLLLRVDPEPAGLERVADKTWCWLLQLETHQIGRAVECGEGIGRVDF